MRLLQSIETSGTAPAKPGAGTTSCPSGCGPDRCRLAGIAGRDGEHPLEARQRIKQTLRLERTPAAHVLGGDEHTRFHKVLRRLICRLDTPSDELRCCSRGDYWRTEEGMEQRQIRLTVITVTLNNDRDHSRLWRRTHSGNRAIQTAVLSVSATDGPNGSRRRRLRNQRGGRAHDQACTVVSNSSLDRSSRGSMMSAGRQGIA